MKTLFYGIFAMLFAAPSLAQVASDKVQANNYFKENVALLDAYLSVANSTEYSKHLVFKNFGTGIMPTEISFNGQPFLDDGKINDRVAGDGIYSTPRLYTTDYQNVKNAGGKLSVMREAFVKDPVFKHSRELGSGSAKNNGIIGIECDMTFGTCGCFADQQGWCNCCCVTLSNCKIKISL